MWDDEIDWVGMNWWNLVYCQLYIYTKWEYEIHDEKLKVNCEIETFINWKATTLAVNVSRSDYLHIYTVEQL